MAKDHSRSRSGYRSAAATQSQTPEQTSSLQAMLKPGSEMVVRILSAAPTCLHPRPRIPRQCCRRIASWLPLAVLAPITSLFYKPLQRAFTSSNRWICPPVPHRIINGRTRASHGIYSPARTGQHANTTGSATAHASTGPRLIHPAAQQLFANIIPQPNAMLPTTLLFFLDALKQGTPRQWLGEDVPFTTGTHRQGPTWWRN